MTKTMMKIKSDTNFSLSRMFCVHAKNHKLCKLTFNYFNDATGAARLPFHRHNETAKQFRVSDLHQLHDKRETIVAYN